MNQYDRADRGAYISLGLIFGATAGLIAGMLTAPKSGKEMRDDLRHKADEAKGRAHEHYAAQREVMKEKLTKTLDKSKQVVNDAADSAKHAVDKTADKAKLAMDQGKTETTARL